VVLIAYMVAELYLSSKGWLVALPDGRELAHLRMRNLLLLVATPVMAALGFAVGWFSHVDADPSHRASRQPNGGNDGDGDSPAAR
jgi:hypothetical protein